MRLLHDARYVILTPAKAGGRIPLVKGALIVVIIFILSTLSAHAQVLPPEVANQIKGEYTQFSGIQVEKESSKRVLINTISNIVNWALSAVAIVFVVLMVYAGYRFMTAGADAEARQGALHTIRSAVIGLAIVFASFMITKFVIGNIISPPSSQPYPGRVAGDVEEILFGGDEQPQ